MNASHFSLRHLIVKVSIYIAIFYFSILATSILITGYLFLNLNNYKTRIEKVVSKHTGYTLKVSSIQTKLSDYYLPAVIINDASLSNPLDPKQNFNVKKLVLVFSYSSIWNLEPIFKKINIYNSNINIEYLKDGSIVVNGINLNNPDKKVLENTKNSPIDLENWILKQSKINIFSTNLSFLDRKNNLPKIELSNIDASLENGIFQQHDFVTAIDDIGNKNMIKVKLSWKGGKISKWQELDKLALKLQTITKKNKLAEVTLKYLPTFGVLEKFNATTALDLEIKKGQLQFLTANFDIKNFSSAIVKEKKHLINFPKLGGNINIKLIDNTHYEILANNLTIDTNNGYILNNKKIAGNYYINKHGEISMDSTNLASFNNLLPIFPYINNLTLSGTLDIIKFNWLGNIFKPSSYVLFSKFTKLSIKSRDENIPSLDNITGDLSITNIGGKINLFLNNSTLNYSKVFLIPYKFKYLSSQINWTINKNKTINVTLAPTKIQTVDFDGGAEGKYIYTPGKLGHLELTAYVDKLSTSKVGDYLPKQIGVEVHKWLNMALIGGYGVKGTMTLKGELNDFPFAHSKGTFNVDALVDNGKLLYVEGWPTLDNIVGKFIIRNQKIIIQATSGKVSGNNFKNALVIIPDMTSNNPYLTADGVATGSTQKFMEYLKHTPVNEIIGKIPEKVETKGDGLVNLHLMVPFDDPNQTKIDGNYTFYNNQIKFDFLVPVLNMVSGKLFFTDHGLTIDKINAKALNSTVELNAHQSKDGMIHFKVLSQDLNYLSVAKFYVPFLSNLIQGRAATNIYFDINLNGLHKIWANSNLLGVTIDTAKPLSKSLITPSKVNFMFTTDDQTGSNINFDYADLLFGNIKLDNNSKIVSGQIDIGKNKFIHSSTNNNAKLQINANLDDIYINEWLSTIESIVQTKPKAIKTTLKNTPKLRIIKEKSQLEVIENPDIFPIEVLLYTKHLHIGSSKLGNANADILINNNYTVFNFNGSRTTGFGKYDYNEKQLNLFLEHFRLFITKHKLEQITQSKKNEANKLLFESTPKTYTRIFNNPNKVNSNESSIIDFLNFELVNHESNIPDLELPKVNLNIKKLFVDNQNLGSLGVKMIPSGRDLFIESGILNGENAEIHFHGTNFCMNCSPGKSYVNMQIDIQIKNLGNLVETLGYGRQIDKGNGKLLATLQWNGLIQDFELKNAIGDINVDLRSGKFLKVNSNNILGSILGILNLQTIVSFAQLSFNNIFVSGFYFDDLQMHSYLINNKIDIKNLTMSGSYASVNSHGNIDITNNNVDLYLTVSPKISGLIAIGIAVANPIAGAIAYIGQWILRGPFDKLFSFTYHVQGPINAPTTTQIGVSKQIAKNVNNAVGNDNTNDK